MSPHLCSCFSLYVRKGSAMSRKLTRTQLVCATVVLALVSTTLGGVPMPSVAPLVFESCAQHKTDYPTAEDGLYTTLANRSMYCDMTTDGGGWTLVAAFDGPTRSKRNYTEKYALYFNLENQWIHGNSDGIPLTDEYNIIDDFFVYSHDWREFLTVGEEYELRMRALHPEYTFEFDFAWIFTYNGHVTQKTAPEDIDRRTWLLDDWVVLYDNTTFGWDAGPDEYSRFMLPITPATTGNVFSGCGNFVYSENPCAMKNNPDDRPYGVCGVFGSQVDNGDPAGQGPNLGYDQDIIYIWQRPTHFGISNRQIGLRYYIRPLRTEDRFTPYNLSVEREQPDESCDRLIRSNSSLSSGVYQLLRGGEAVPTYCHFYDDGGEMKAWTLMTDMVYGGFGNGKTYNDRNQYTNYFENDLWIKGMSDGLPEDVTVNDLSGFFVHSHDWRKHLHAGGIYRLKQSFGKPGGTNIGINGATEVLEVSYEFVYNGFVEQGAVPNAQDAMNRAWRLTDRIVHQDTTNITWDTPDEVVRFYLPFTAGASSGSLYTACLSYEFATSGCGKDTPGLRRFGNAGIIGASADFADPAGAFAPHLRENHDLVFIHQGAGYQFSGDPTVLQYWIQEL